MDTHSAANGTEDEPDGRTEWQGCRTLEDAAELAAQWFEGRIDFMPGRKPGAVKAAGYGDRQNLARISRLGLLVTDASEVPPQTGGSGTRQFVTGFGTEATARKLVQLSCSSEIVTAAQEPGTENHANIPSSLGDGGSPSKWLGRTKGMNFDGGWETWAQGANPSLADLLAGLWYLEVFDPRWNRRDLLLPSVIDALSLEGSRPDPGHRQERP